MLYLNKLLHFSLIIILYNDHNDLKKCGEFMFIHNNLQLFTTIECIKKPITEDTFQNVILIEDKRVANIDNALINNKINLLYDEVISKALLSDVLGEEVIKNLSNASINQGNNLKRFEASIESIIKHLSDDEVNKSSIEKLNEMALKMKPIIEVQHLLGNTTVDVMAELNYIENTLKKIAKQKNLKFQNIDELYNIQLEYKNAFLTKTLLCFFGSHRNQTSYKILENGDKEINKGSILAMLEILKEDEFIIMINDAIEKFNLIGSIRLTKKHLRQKEIKNDDQEDNVKKRKLENPIKHRDNLFSFNENKDNSFSSFDSLSSSSNTLKN